MIWLVVLASASFWALSISIRLLSAMTAMSLVRDDGHGVVGCVRARYSSRTRATSSWGCG
jgi:hypothetical protein